MGKRSSQKLSVLRGEQRISVSHPFPGNLSPKPQPTPGAEAPLHSPHLQHSGPSSLAQQPKDFLSLLLRRSLRQTHEPFQSEGWGGVLIKVIILSRMGYLQRHLKSLGGFKGSSAARAQEIYCLCGPLVWGCQHCWCPARETWGCIQEPGDALPVAKSRMSVLERTRQPQVKGGSLQSVSTFFLSKEDKNL